MFLTAWFSPPHPLSTNTETKNLCAWIQSSVLSFYCAVKQKSKPQFIWLTPLTAQHVQLQILVICDLLLPPSISNTNQQNCSFLQKIKGEISWSQQEPQPANLGWICAGQRGFAPFPLINPKMKCNEPCQGCTLFSLRSAYVFPHVCVCVCFAPHLPNCYTFPRAPRDWVGGIKNWRKRHTVSGADLISAQWSWWKTPVG